MRELKILLTVSTAFMSIYIGAIASQNGNGNDVKPPTFYHDVLPILQKNCQTCHRPGEVAPFSLLTYESARPWATAMRKAVSAGQMPPWFADPEYGHFENDRRLAKKDIDTIVRWADSGAPEGDAAEGPQPVRFSEGWNAGNPDEVFQMPVDFPVPASGKVDYTYFVVPTNFKEDRWIETVEVRPGNPKIVHHIVVVVRDPAVRDKYLKDARPGEPYTPPPKVMGGKIADDGTGEFVAAGGGVEVIGVFVPGGMPFTLKPGQARLIKAGSDIIFQMHYTTNGHAGTDRSRIGFTYAKTPPKERVFNTSIDNYHFRIPPGAADYKVHARVTLQHDATLLSLLPHMHLRGKAFEYRATYPSGETETLLRISKYDFNWQLIYHLERPKILPKGTLLECIAIYDNSSNNPANPDPKAEVLPGQQTWDEMLAGFMDLALPPREDPSAIAGPKPPGKQNAPDAGSVH